MRRHARYLVDETWHVLIKPSYTVVAAPYFFGRPARVVASKVQNTISVANETRVALRFDHFPGLGVMPGDGTATGHIKAGEHAMLVPIERPQQGTGAGIGDIVVCAGAMVDAVPPGARSATLKARQL